MRVPRLPASACAPAAAGPARATRIRTAAPLSVVLASLLLVGLRCWVPPPLRGAAAAQPVAALGGRSATLCEGQLRRVLLRVPSERRRLVAAAAGIEDRDDPGLSPALLEWLETSNEVDTSEFAVEVGPSDLAPGELGLITKGKLEPGDILAWAPKSMLLNKDKAVEMWGEDVETLMDRTAISLLLVHERFVQGEKSKWASYMPTLPRFQMGQDVAGPSFMWTEEEWEWLDGSDCYVATVQMRQAFEEEFSSLEDLFSRRPDDFPPSIFTLDNFMWGAAVVSSRAYGDDEEGSFLAVPPVVDFLNHKSGALQLTRFGNGIVAYAHKHYDKGEEAFINYGGKTNAQLLSQYGFLIDGNADEAIFLRFGTHLHIEAPLADEKRSLLGQLFGEDVDPDSAIIKLARRPREWLGLLLPVVRILALTSADAVPTDAWDLQAPQASETEAAAWSVLEAALKRRADEYPASLEEDKRQLAEGWPSGGISERNSLGLRLRVSEQELIGEALVQIAERREEALMSQPEVA